MSSPVFDSVVGKSVESGNELHISQVSEKARPALVPATAAFVGIAAFTGAPPTAQATDFQFLLHDHPDGGLADPEYGLRLDGLYGSESNDFTFSFDAPGTGMTLLYDGQSNTVRIVGRAYGGIDLGSAWDANNVGFIDVDFTYRQNLVTTGSGTFGTDSENLGVKTTSDAQTVGTGNSGTVTLATGVWGGGGTIGNEYVLFDQNYGSYSFKLNNFGDHRLGGHPGYGGPETFVGWGWVNHWAAGATPRTHVYSSDFLFTAQLLNPTPIARPRNLDQRSYWGWASPVWPGAVDSSGAAPDGTQSSSNLSSPGKSRTFFVAFIHG